MSPKSAFNMKNLFVTLFITLSAASIPHVKAAKFAVLVATTKSWVNYRHQASVMKAYHSLVANGFNKNNIVTMVYDDIANHPKNPEPGIVKSHPNGPNVNANLTKDYTGDNVNAKNFLAVLSGNNSEADGKVISSGPKDTIFIFISGFGGYGVINFPSGPVLISQNFLKKLIELRLNKKARKILVNLDVSCAASIADLVPRNEKIFIIAATHYYELPYAAYCDKRKQICYNSLFGAAWTYRVDRLRQLKYGKRENLWDLFNWIRTITAYSTVNMFGELEIGRSKVKEFLDYKQEKDHMNEDIITELADSILDEVSDKLDEEPENEILNHQYESLSEIFDENKENKKSALEPMENNDFGVMSADIAPVFLHSDEKSKTELLRKREIVKDTMKDIISKLGLDFDSLAHPTGIFSKETAENYEKSISAFHENCFDLNENTHVLSHLTKLAKINQMGIPLENQILAMKSVCSGSHREIQSVH